MVVAPSRELFGDDPTAPKLLHFMADMRVVSVYPVFSFLFLRGWITVSCRYRYSVQSNGGGTAMIGTGQGRLPIVPRRPNSPGHPSSRGQGLVVHCFIYLFTRFIVLRLRRGTIVSGGAAAGPQ
ncbi:hypothetical protein Sjap_023810 [Stephania japonica]|uniref:Uncharacterized protein n=1 Tax=Stephania japonica TaxID=461633 RepID=A0AAP0EHK2_9MAGN